MNSSAPGTYLYDNAFFRYIQEGSTRSAQVVVPLVIEALGVKSVLDVGCGAGAWLHVYGQQGISDYLGVDGEYVQRESLLIPAENFRAQDITRPFDLSRSFDLAQCLEVGEHLPQSASETLVENLVRHSRMVVFSAATPGQGGENHINEQPFEFWRALFSRHGYTPFDFVRPAIRHRTDVEIWYRHNILLYVARDHVQALPAAVAAAKVPDDKAIVRVASWTYRFRMRLLAPLPVGLVSKLAVCKHSCVLLYRRMMR